MSLIYSATLFFGNANIADKKQTKADDKRAYTKMVLKVSGGA